MEAQALLNRYGWTQHFFEDDEYYRYDLWVPLIEDTHRIYVFTEKTEMSDPICFRFVKADSVREAMASYDETVTFYITIDKLELVLTCLV